MYVRQCACYVLTDVRYGPTYVRMQVKIRRARSKGKKFEAVVDRKIILFGAARYSDFTQIKDPERKERYIARHRKREDWTRSGLDTASFYAKHLLWNKPSLTARFGT